MTRLTQKKIVPLISLAVIALLLLAVLLFWHPDNDDNRLSPSPAGGNFTLQGATGPVSLSDYRGKVVLLYFGYTSCPDICPTSLGLMSLALSQLAKEELARVRGLFISVDPQRDTPERLAEYSRHFHPNISGITGSDAEVAEVAARYGAIYQRAEGDTALGYSVDHSSATHVIDPQGEIVATLPHGASPATILQAIRPLLIMQQ
ncbi:MAG: SCO family protein [Gammaproteobacteria bacterium]|nr:SCO family protein [Gammaproteobacteria bacterium]